MPWSRPCSSNRKNRSCVTISPAISVWPGGSGARLRYLSQALAIDPAYRELAAVESDFDRLRGDPDFQAICAAAANH